jgi:hypothetical protein
MSCLDQFDKSESKKKFKFNQALLAFLHSKTFIEVITSSYRISLPTRDVYNHHLLVGKAEISSEELSAEEYS